VRRLHDSVGVIGVAETTSHFVRLLYHNISIVLGGLRDISFHISRGNPNPTSHTSSTENFVKPFKCLLGEMIQSLISTVFTFMSCLQSSQLFLIMSRGTGNWGKHIVQ